MCGTYILIVVVVVVVLVFQSPTVKQLLIAVDKVTDWHQLGLFLGLEMSTLREVHQSFHAEGLPRMKCEVFERWLRTTPGASWEDLVTALEEMGENVVAGEVAVSYCGRPLTTGGHG